MAFVFLVCPHRVEFLKKEESLSPREAWALERAALSLMDVLDSGEYEVSGVYDKQEDVFKILQVLVIRLRVLLCPGTVQLLQWFIENDDPESALSEGWQDALFGAFTHESAGEPSLREPA